MRHRAVVALLACLALLAAACASGPPAGTAAGTTVTGKVVSFTDATVTLETTTGRETFGLTGETEGRDNLTVGANVAIDLRRGSGGGEALAARIRPAGG